jgi:hypothetical protein
MASVRSRPLVAGLVSSLLVTILGLAPITAAHGSDLPDPRRPDTRAPVSPEQLKAAGAITRSNHVPEVGLSDRRAFESTGASVVESKDGLLVLEVADERGAPVYVAAYDTKTRSGVGVIGLQFIRASELEALESGSSTFNFAFGPQAVAAHRNGTNHWHNVGFPFHDNCSYVYNWANGDSTFHICPIDVSYLQYVATGWGALLGGLFNPVIGFVAGLLIYSGINYFKNADGSIDLFGPAVSITTHYGYTYYWGSRGGWYWHYPSSSIYYGYARRDSTGVLYRTH